MSGAPVKNELSESGHADITDKSVAPSEAVAPQESELPKDKSDKDLEDLEKNPHVAIVVIGILIAAIFSGLLIFRYKDKIKKWLSGIKKAGDLPDKDKENLK